MGDIMQKMSMQVMGASTDMFSIVTCSADLCREILEKYMLARLAAAKAIYIWYNVIAEPAR